MMTLDETIKNYEKAAEEKEKQAIWVWSKEDNSYYEDCIKVVKELRQLAGWLKELKVYKELNTYNRSSKCSKCKYEDSAYFCDDCIWNFVNKFEPKEVTADEDDITNNNAMFIDD